MTAPLIVLCFFPGATGGRRTWAVDPGAQLGLALGQHHMQVYYGVIISTSLRSTEGMLAFSVTPHEAFERNYFQS